MNYLLEKIQSIARKESTDETASILSFINTPPYLEYKHGLVEVRAKGMGTGAIAFRKLVIEKRKLEKIYEGFFRRDKKQFIFPLGVCYGPTGDGPGIEFGLEVNRTTTPNEIYFRLQEQGKHFSHLIGRIVKLSKEKKEEMTYHS